MKRDYCYERIQDIYLENVNKGYSSKQMVNELNNKFNHKYNRNYIKKTLEVLYRVGYLDQEYKLNNLNKKVERIYYINSYEPWTKPYLKDLYNKCIHIGLNITKDELKEVYANKDKTGITPFIYLQNKYKEKIKELRKPKGLLHITP